MSVRIRSRLLLLALAWALPALTALLAVVYVAARSERHADERLLYDTSRALSMAVARELDRRAVVARVLATSRPLFDLPQLDAAEAAIFQRQARAAMTGLQGWVELRNERGALLLHTRDSGAAPSAALSAALPATPATSPLQTDAAGSARVLVSHPVQRDGAVLGHVVVALLPSELQRVIDAQRLPPGWVGSVLDSRQVVVARRPAVAIGEPAAPELLRRLAAAEQGHFEILDEGEPLHGHYSTTDLGWTVLGAMPQAQFGGYLQGAPVRIIGAAGVLLLLAVAGALWVARGIAGAVVALQQMATRLSAGEPVAPRSTGIAECDAVAATLVQASNETRSARLELEQKVAAAVERTRSAEQQASRSQRVAALGRLTGGVAHDFNNLLGVVGNSAHLVQRHAEALPPLRAPVAAILRAVDVGSRLTQQLTRFAGRRPLRAQPLDLRRHVDELQPLLQQVVGKRVAVTMAVAEDTLPIVVDAGELELALLNLALNARDSMPAGGTLQVHARNAGPGDAVAPLAPPCVLIEVIDSGQGMDSSVAERVFEPFFTTKPVGEGTGLGLAQVHGFCTQAGGTARLSSTPGVGTRVTLLLPGGSAGAAAAAGAVTSSRPPAADSLAGLALVVVEDNDALGEATAALLRSFGAEVMRVRNAHGALGAIERGDRIDAVLSDVMMPGEIDGVELGQRLRARTPPLPVVLTSGYAPRAEALEGFEFLHKPASSQALVEALRRALGR